MTMEYRIVTLSVTLLVHLPSELWRNCRWKHSVIPMAAFNIYEEIKFPFFHRHFFQTIWIEISYFSIDHILLGKPQTSFATIEYLLWLVMWSWLLVFTININWFVFNIQIFIIHMLHLPKLIWYNRISSGT